jgi:hypothetical protein
VKRWWDSWWLFNWLPREARYWGYSKDWYNGPIYSFGFWYFNAGYAP